MSTVPIGRTRQDNLRSATERLLRSATRERRWTRISLAVGAGLLGFVILLSVLQPVLGLPNPDYQNYNAVLQAPSLAHPFGTDSLGRDMLSRTLSAGRIDLSVCVAITAISVGLGFTLGAAAGFFGGVVDSFIMRLADVALAFPFLVLVLAIVAVFGPGLKGVFVAVPLVGWALYARLTRAEMLAVREKGYLQAARTLGFSRRRAFFRHALPNVWRPALVYSMSDIVMNIILLATLSYLGVGVQAPTPEWGELIADGQSQLLTGWWVATLPGLVVVLVGFAFSLTGDSLAHMLGEEVKLGA